MKIDIACSQCIALDVANHCNHTDDDLYNVADGSLFRSRPKASKLNRFKCSQCSKAYTRKANLVDHVQSEHSVEPVKYSCKKCSKTFLRMSDRNRHERNQHGDMRFVCSQQPDHEGDGCGKAFARLDALKEHRSTLKCAKSRRKAGDQEYLIRRLDSLGNMLYEISAEAARSRSSSPEARVSDNEPSEPRRVEAVLQLGDDTRYHESGSSDPSFWAGWQDRQTLGRDARHAAAEATQNLATEPMLSPLAGMLKAERLRRLRSDFKSQYPEIVKPSPINRDHASNNGGSLIQAAPVTRRSASESDSIVAWHEDNDRVDLIANGWRVQNRREDAGDEPVKQFDGTVKRDAFSKRLAQAKRLHLSQLIESTVIADDKIPTAAAVNVQSHHGMHAATGKQATQGARTQAALPHSSEQLAYFGQGHRKNHSPTTSSIPGAPPMEQTGLSPAKIQAPLRSSMHNSSDLLEFIGWMPTPSPPTTPVFLHPTDNAFDMLLAAANATSSKSYILPSELVDLYPKYNNH